MMMRSRGTTVLERKSNAKGRGFLILAVWLSGLSSLSCDFEISPATITAEEFRFTPTIVKLPAHQTLRLIIRNQGRERHVFQSPILSGPNVRFYGNGLATPGKSADGIPIPPGGRIEFSLELAEGLYPFRCRIKGHKGMAGTLVVEK